MFGVLPQRRQFVNEKLPNKLGSPTGGFRSSSGAGGNSRCDGGRSFCFPLASDIPAGLYQVEIGVYSRTDMQRFAVFEEEQPIADRLLLEPISVVRQ